MVSALRVSDSIDLRWGPRICISNMVPGDADAAGSGGGRGWGGSIVEIKVTNNGVPNNTSISGS